MNNYVKAYGIAGVVSLCASMLISKLTKTNPSDNPSLRKEALVTAGTAAIGVAVAHKAREHFGVDRNDSPFKLKTKK